MPRIGKAYFFWIGLALLILASLALSTILWLIFYYHPANCHRLHWDYPTNFPSYFWGYYVWYILGSIAFITIGVYMVRVGLRKKLTS